MSSPSAFKIGSNHENMVNNKHERPTKKDPSEDNSSETTFEYTKPAWAKVMPSNYYYEVLKGGVIVDSSRLQLGKDFLLFGRLPSCNIIMDHPSISRQHAIIQYGQGMPKIYHFGANFYINI